MDGGGIGGAGSIDHSLWMGLPRFRCGVSVEVVGGLVGVVPVKCRLFLLTGSKGPDADEQGDGGVLLAGLGFDLESVVEAWAPGEVEGGGRVVGMVFFEVDGRVGQVGVEEVEGLVQSMHFAVNVDDVFSGGHVDLDV